MKVVEKLGKIDKDHIGVLGQLDVELLTIQVRVYLCIRKVNICM